jgi:zinc transporter ZupT
MSELPPFLVVFLYALITALATGLGAIPFVFVRRLSPQIVGWANAIASGLMIGASFGLVLEGTTWGAIQTVAGGLLGVVFILFTQRILGEHEIEFGGMKGASARQMLLMLIVMTVHSFSEGVAVGVAFGGGAALATVITVAIAVHNIPEGLAISAVMRPQGVSVLKCAGWSIFSSLPQPIMAVPAYIFVEEVAPALPYGLGFAAGAMVFMVLVELLPEAYGQTTKPSVAVIATFSLIAMVLFQHFL